MCSVKYIVALATITVLFLQEKSVTAQDPQVLKKIRDCLREDGAIICLKERALDVLNDTIMSEKPLTLYGFIDVIKDPGYKQNVTTDDFLPRDLNQRTLKLNDMLYDKVEEFFESRSVKVNLGTLFEGRGKKDKKGGMMMMGGLAMAGMMAQLFMGKIAFMAGAALLIAKIALLLSSIIGIKKLSGGGGGGGESAHVVYATSSDSGGGGGGGYGHSHGGWHRSLGTSGEDPQNIAYKAHVPDNEVVDNYAY